VSLPTPTPQLTSRASLSLKHVVFVLLTTTWVQVTCVYFIYRLHGIDFGAILKHPDVVAQLTVIPSLIAIAWIWFTAIWGQANGFAVVGAVAPKGKWVRLSFLIAFGCFIVNVLFGNLMAGLMQKKPEASIPSEIITEASVFSLFGIGFAVTVIAPIFEELLFRGILYGYLRNRLGLLLSGAIAAGIHAAFHGNLVTLPGLFLVFLIFAYLYEKTGTIWAPCLAHGVHNSIVFCIAYAHATKLFEQVSSSALAAIKAGRRGAHPRW
jgi:membrane protease YdiL (CAAX protease family)